MRNGGFTMKDGDLTGTNLDLTKGGGGQIKLWPF